jgi:predicted RNA-binding Zn ribbon-like protein
MVITTSSGNQRPSPLLVADHLALDFLNSIASPWGEPIEWLDSGAAFLDWLGAAGAIDAAVAKRFRSRSGVARELDAVAGRARDLREWLRAFVSRHAGKALAAEALGEIKPLNLILARDLTYRQIVAAAPASGGEDGGLAQTLDWRQKRNWTGAEQLLMPIAEAIGNLVCRCDFRLVRACENPKCTLFFYDRTRSHARRWCSMAVCGNRAKAAAHRARHRR